MNINKTDDDRFLERYLNPGTVEKAPEGFVSKTMTRIRIESVPDRKSFLKRYKVPVISTIVVSLLIAAAAALTPSQNSANIFSGIAEYIKIPESLVSGISEIKLPEIRATGINLPEWLPYALTAMLLFGIVDRALFRIFHRE